MMPLSIYERAGSAGRCPKAARTLRVNGPGSLSSSSGRRMGRLAQTMPMPNRQNRIAATWAPSSVGSKIELTMMATVPIMQKSIRPAVRLVSGEPVSPVGTPHPPEPAQEHEKPQSEADDPGAGEHVKRGVVGAPQRQRLGLGLADAHTSDVREVGSEAESVDEVRRRFLLVVDLRPEREPEVLGPLQLGIRRTRMSETKALNVLHELRNRDGAFPRVQCGAGDGGEAEAENQGRHKAQSCCGALASADDDEADHDGDGGSQSSSPGLGGPEHDGDRGSRR